MIDMESLRVESQREILDVRTRVRAAAAEAGLGVVDLTKLVTAASELARNMVIYGGGGECRIQRLDSPRPGVQVVFQDAGPGIPDVERAMEDGFSTGRSLGLGLPGARRLVDHFEIESVPGAGTRVAVVKWSR